MIAALVFFLCLIGVCTLESGALSFLGPHLAPCGHLAFADDAAWRAALGLPVIAASLDFPQNSAVASV
jgi:hypothetical protein